MTTIPRVTTKAAFVFLALSLCIVLCIVYSQFGLVYVTISNTKQKEEGAQMMTNTQLNFNTKPNVDTKDTTALEDNSKCLTFEDDLNDLVFSAKQVFITMPPKSAGSSLKTFVNKCIPYNQPDSNNFINHPDRIKEFMTDALHLPKVIAGHSYDSRTVLNLLQNTGKNTLLIFVHREETSRLLSGLKMTVTSRACAKTIPFTDEYDEVRINETHCEIDESFLVDKIIDGDKGVEMSRHVGKILTCEVYDKIEDTAPNMVFLNYKQVDKLQQIIAKHHCPEMLEKPVHANVADEKEMHVSIALKATDTVVSLEEWIDAKGELLEWGYQLKQGEGCQAKTRHMEDKLMACDDELMAV